MQVPVLLSLLLLTMPIKGQQSKGGKSLPPAAKASWAAAQRAQQQKNYPIAVQDYLKVISLSPGFAEAYMNLGLVYELQSRRPDAIAMFEKAIQLKPDLAGAQYFLGVDYCKQGDAKTAIPHLEAAVRARPNLPDAWSWLASAYQMDGETSRQVSTLEAGLQANPRSIDLLYMVGQAYQQLGKDAEVQLQQKDLESGFLERLLAENYAASGHPAVAMLHLEAALKATPDRPGLHMEVAEVLLHAGNLKRAEDEIEAELRVAPHSLRAMVRRGEVELLRGDVRAALADWSQALELDPARCEAILGVQEFGYGDTSRERLTNELRAPLIGLRASIESQDRPASRLALAFISTQEDPTRPVASRPVGGDSDSVKDPSSCTEPQMRDWLVEDRLRPVAACSTPILNQPLAPDLRLEIVRALCETGQPQRALAALDGSAPLQVDSPEAQYWKARCYNHLALAAYLQLFQVDPDSYQAQVILGEMDEARGEDSKAIEEYQKALAQRPNLPNLHYQVGHLEWKSHKSPEAREQFQAELALNPNHTGALFEMGSACLQDNQADQALSYLMKVFELDPSYPDLHEVLGIAYTQLESYKEAEKELKIAAPSDKDGGVHYQLARLYSAMGRSAEAHLEFALGDQLREATHQANEERVQRIAAAEAALKQP
ncbi:MAG TPA: tetratricopeptide repeat protein [Terriglobia bacterium]|nr:tetratricopeptide repeat protein [Terriglobia bacterium]